jgi:hypothetical protein
VSTASHGSSFIHGSLSSQVRTSARGRQCGRGTHTALLLPLVPALLHPHPHPHPHPHKQPPPSCAPSSSWTPAGRSAPSRPPPTPTSGARCLSASAASASSSSSPLPSSPTAAWRAARRCGGRLPEARAGPRGTAAWRGFGALCGPVACLSSLDRAAHLAPAPATPSPPPSPPGRAHRRPLLRGQGAAGRLHRRARRRPALGCDAGPDLGRARAVGEHAGFLARPAAHRVARDIFALRQRFRRAACFRARRPRQRRARR